MVAITAEYRDLFDMRPMHLSTDMTWKLAYSWATAYSIWDSAFWDGQTLALPTVWHGPRQSDVDL
jgi:hypothetical protein